MVNGVRDAYSSRAAEYVERFGSMGAVHPSDRQLVATWADGIEGAVLDAGCGPGQWTNFLHEVGIPALILFAQVRLSGSDHFPDGHRVVSCHGEDYEAVVCRDVRDVGRMLGRAHFGRRI